MMNQTKRVAVVGATGYAGAELTALLARHPHVELAAVYASENSKPIPFSAVHPSLIRMTGPAVEPFALAKLLDSKAEVVFLATPNEVSAELVPALLDNGLRVIDLSGAFRLAEPGDYPKWYGFDHPNPALLQKAVYGLTEFCNGDLANAQLVANPGCYPTAILLALRPLTYLINRDQLIVADAKSGVSGAGKKSDLSYSFSELAGNFKAYGVGKHKHEPEIRNQLHLGDKAALVFVPHLLPVVRGLLATLHVSFVRPVTAAELTENYQRAYGNSEFVRVLPAGTLPEMRDVVSTPYAEIGFQLLNGGTRAVIVSVIDNLLKGAASQAVQNFNRMNGFDEKEGLA